MKKLILIGIPVLLAVVAGVVVVRREKEAEQAETLAARAKAAPVPVLLTNAAALMLPVEVRTFGAVEPLATVAVKSQITGILSNVVFAEGQEVHEGDLLFVIDPREREAALRQAEAALSRDRVQCENAAKEADRQEALLAKGISAQDVRDAAVTASETFKATTRADEAAADFARLQLGYCWIRSPVSGRTGNVLIHRGNLVKADEATLVTINQIHPILVRFTLPQQDLARVREAANRGGVKVLATPAGTPGSAEAGVLTFIDNAVDERTGTIELKARFENTPAVLWPGQFVAVVLQLADGENVVAVPETTVLLGQQGAYVYVRDVMSGRVTPRPVTVDRTVAGLSVISRGLAAGEEIVVDGHLRLKPGVLVTSRPVSKPDSKAAGRP